MSARGILRRAHRASHRRKALVRGAAWVGALAAVALAVANVALGAAAGSGRCVPDPPPDPLAHPSKHAVLETEDEGFRIRFDDARGVGGAVVVFTDDRVKLAQGDLIQASMSPYLRRRDGTSLFPGRDPLTDRVSPSVQVLRINPLGEVEVCLEFDAGLVDGTEPGQYTGAVGISGADLAIPSTTPVVVTFRSSRWLAITLAFSGVLLGLLVKMFTELAAAQRSPGVGPSSFRAYVRSWSFPLAIILGTIAGFTVYVEVYDSDPVWGDSSSDWLKLFGTCFAFQLASIGSIDLARRLVGEPPSAA